MCIRDRIRIGGFDYKISIISRDDEGNAEKSFLVSQELVQEGVAGVVGSAFNATTKAAIPNYLEYNIPIITTSAPGTDLNKAGNNFFRIIINNDQIIENVGNFILNEIKPVKIVLIDDGKEYSINFNLYLKEILSGDTAAEQIKSIKTYSCLLYTSKHPIIGYEIVKEITFLKDNANAVLYHHEREDGLGYPFGIDGKKIPYYAKIISIADSYDAMTTDRPYRKALTLSEAILEIRKNKNKQFDGILCEKMLEVLNEENQVKL